MILIDNDKCTGCGICLKYLDGYCVNKKEGLIEIDYLVCNECQKCISICPGLAFSYNGKPPKKIEKSVPVKEDDFIDLLKRRRSIKHFKNEEVPKELLERIIKAGGYAPTMNKKIEAIIIDAPDIIRKIDQDAVKYYTKLYKLLFATKMLYGFFRLFADTMPIVKRKMERDLKSRNHIVKDNTQALVIMLGRSKVPVTESSAQYYLANMLLYCEAAGLGSCLMDSLKISLNKSKSMRAKLNIPKKLKILGVLALGYPEEKIINIPEGYQIKTGWNARIL